MLFLFKRLTRKKNDCITEIYEYIVTCKFQKDNERTIKSCSFTRRDCFIVQLVNFALSD